MPVLHPSAAKVVQRQLEAYNARDLERWLSTYSEDAEQYLLHVGTLASGKEAIRTRMVERFADPALHAELALRMVMDNVVVDHEFITRTLRMGSLPSKRSAFTKSRPPTSSKPRLRSAKRDRMARMRPSLPSPERLL